MKHILLVDDDPYTVSLLALQLQREAHVVHIVNSGERALASTVSSEPDLIVLDLVLPDTDGITVLRQLRSAPTTRHIPVILLTGPKFIRDRITGLEIGADDCVDKPFNPRELLLRIQAVLRRTQKINITHEQRIGHFCLDRKNFALHYRGELLDLTLTEYKLIAHFLDNPNVLHTRRELLSGVWGYHEDTNTRTLDTHIRRLREKLGSVGARIKTIRGQGYQLNVPFLAAA